MAGERVGKVSFVWVLHQREIEIGKRTCKGQKWVVEEGDNNDAEGLGEATVRVSTRLSREERSHSLVLSNTVWLFTKLSDTKSTNGRGVPQWWNRVHGITSGSKLGAK